MRLIESEYAARLKSGAATTCLCWRLERLDGVIVGVTEHDRDLVVDGVIYRPGEALESGSFTTSLGLKPGQASARGALSSEAITDADLAAGLWDGARVDVLRADWERPDLFVVIWSGQLSEIVRGRTGFEADLVSLKADFERSTGRVYSRSCDAVLGDARCSVDVTAYLGLTCDQAFSTCKGVFSNVENFRGFPHLPGTDFVLSGPAASGNDGGKR